MHKNISNYITGLYFLLTKPISAITKRTLIKNFNNKKKKKNTENILLLLV